MAADRRAGGREFELRRKACGGMLREQPLDALLVTAPPNVRYLTGFTGSNGSVLLYPDSAVLFTDPRYAIQAARESDCRVKVCRGPILPEVLAAARRMRVRKLGFERSRIGFEAWDALRSGLPLNATLEPATFTVERARMVKSPEELARIRASVETNGKAFEQAVRRARPGMRESELAGEIEYRMRRLGAEKPAFETIVASGARTALPHASPTSARFRATEAVLVDMGAVRDGYASDMTRMLFLGTPSAKMRRVYGAVLEAQLAALSAVRPGVAAGTVDRAARRVLERHGLGRAFVHSTGHGLGLEIHEAPRLGKREKTVLEAGMVVTVEPGAYLEGFGGVRIEDTVVVTAGGCEILTTTSKELRVL